MEFWICEVLCSLDTNIKLSEIVIQICLGVDGNGRFPDGCSRGWFLSDEHIADSKGKRYIITGMPLALLAVYFVLCMLYVREDGRNIQAGHSKCVSPFTSYLREIVVSPAGISIISSGSSKGFMARNLVSSNVFYSRVVGISTPSSAPLASDTESADRINTGKW